MVQFAKKICVKNQLALLLAVSVLGLGLWVQQVRWWQSQPICWPRNSSASFFHSRNLTKAHQAGPQFAQKKSRLHAFSRNTSKGRKLYFIHIPKCAGVSMHHAFQNENPSIRPWHIWLYNRIDKDNGCVQTLNLDHLTPQQSLDLGLDVRKTYQENIVFAIVRHPYDRVISSYSYMKHSQFIDAEISLDAFIDMFAKIEQAITQDGYIPVQLAEHAIAQSRYIYFDDGEQAVSDILRFEQLDEDWQHLVEKYPEFKMPAVLPHSNKSSHGRAADVLTTTQKEKIYALYEQDFLNFGYAK
jgi:hypothetical protein